MDFKLGLKVDEKLDVSISKDELFDPIFTTQQTDTMFILTSHLKGYGRSDIKIEINEDGSRMRIRGEMAVEEILMEKGQVVKKQVEFQKSFTIPEGVDLDKVKARFDPDESRLVVRMPKSVHGMVGMGIQELKTTETMDLIMKQEAEEEQEKEMRSKCEEEKEGKGGSSIICTPNIAAGSALFVSLIVIVFSFIRSKNDSTKKKD